MDANRLTYFLTAPYCLWRLRKGQAHVCIGCFCKEGFECQAPAPDRIPDYEGQVIKVPCKIK